MTTGRTQEILISMKSTITRAGQTTVPADIRRGLGWPPKSTVDWQVEGDRAIVRLMVPKDDVPLVKMRRVNGRLMLPKDLKLSDESIVRGIRADRASR